MQDGDNGISKRQPATRVFAVKDGMNDRGPDMTVHGGQDGREGASVRYERERRHDRLACKWLGLFHICARSRCRHARRCRGHASACLRAGIAQVPEPVREWVCGMLDAQERSLPFEEARASVAEFEEAYAVWLAGLEARASARGASKPVEAKPDRFAQADGAG